MTQHAYIPDPIYTVGPAATGRSAPGGYVPDGAARLSTDPLFYSSVTLRNVLAGSRYRITRHDTGAELATGVVTGSGNVDFTVSSIPCYANPQQVDIVVRLSSSAPFYKSFQTGGFIPRAGTDVYILQQLDQ